VLGQKTDMIDPDMGKWKYGYDLGGNLITQTDNIGQVLWFKYDPLNRLTEKRQTGSAGTLLAAYTYDIGSNAKGRRTSMSDPSGSASWTYDLRGRVITDSKFITNAGTFNTSFGYDAMDRVLTTTYPTNEVVTQTYNAQGLLENLRSASNNQWYASNLDYNANGSIALLKLSPSIGITYTYYPLNFRLKNIQANALLNLNYAYDPVGNVARITDTTNSSQVISFTYDSLDRLTTASTSAVGNGQYNESYTYNQIGNFTNKAGVTQWYSDTAHDHAITHLNGAQKFWYDANGNMITRTEGSTVFAQQWNFENRLTTVISNGVQTTQFIYDGDGNRVKKIDPNGQPTIYIGAIYEKNLSTTITTTYYFAGSTRIAMRQGGVLTYLAGDHLGSTSLTLDQNGNKIGEMKYRPYGETRYITGSVPTDRRFTGQREESNLGSLYDYGARMFSPVVGRFISADISVRKPQNPQNLNRYAYVLNNPLRYSDPTGLFTQEEIEKYYHVKTWDEVLAFFQKDGNLEGRWGWLAVLQKANLNDFVSMQWDTDIPLPDGHPKVEGTFTGEFINDENGNLIIAGKDYYMDQLKAAHYGKEFGLVHQEPGGIGKRQSYWLTAATDKELTWAGGETDFVGSFGPMPGRHLEPLERSMSIAAEFIAAGEIYHLGVDAIEVAPGTGPAAPAMLAIGVGCWAVATVITIIAVNTYAAP
jgi:RHS repeat-associated protein